MLILLMNAWHGRHALEGMAQNALRVNECIVQTSNCVQSGSRPAELLQIAEVCLMQLIDLQEPSEC